MDRLSIGEIAANADSSYQRPHSTSHDRAGEEGSVQALDRYAFISRHSSPYKRQAETAHSPQDAGSPERLDPLSILALAGKMVGRDHNDESDSM